jgi:hypothetical protein
MKTIPAFSSYFDVSLDKGAIWEVQVELRLLFKVYHLSGPEAFMMSSDQHSWVTVFFLCVCLQLATSNAVIFFIRQSQFPQSFLIFKCNSLKSFFSWTDRGIAVLAKERTDVLHEGLDTVNLIQNSLIFFLKLFLILGGTCY